jgi:type IV secretory pathway component VirB8
MSKHNHKEINALRNTNAILASEVQFYKNTLQKNLKLADNLKNANDFLAKRVRHYIAQTGISILALILSGVLLLINIFF